MHKYATSILGIGFLLFATLSSSPNYGLNSYSVGPGGTNSAGSSSYKLQGTVGDQANNKSSGTTYTTQSGSVNAEQLSVPLAPSLSNGGNAYYNKLQFILNNTAGSSNYPSDTRFALAVSTSPSFTSPAYVQASGLLGGSAVYQTYSTWGGASGAYITGLSPSTAYYVTVAAMQGTFTNTAFGAYATISTVSPSMTFSVSPSSMAIGSIVPGSSVTTSSNLTFNFATNGASGGAVYIAGANSPAGLFSAALSHTIPAVTGNLASQSEGFGIQATNPGQTSGGPFATVGPFNGTGNTVGAESISEQQILSTGSPVVGGTANARLQAKASLNTPASSDYAEALNFVAAGNF